MRRNVLITFSFTLAVLWIPHAVDAAIVRLKRTAQVKSSLIRLRDVAEIYTDSAVQDAQLGDVMVGPAPLPGTRLQLQARTIQAQLASRGIASGNIDLQGSSVVLVTRSREPQASSPHKIIHPGPGTRPVASDDTDRTSRQLRKTRLPDLSARDFQLAQQVVENLVRQYLQQAAPDWGHPKIQPLLTTADAPRILKARAGNPQILSGVQLDDERYLLTLAIPEAVEPEPKISQVDVKVRIVRRPKVFAVSRPVAKGELIHSDDLVEVETDDERNGVTDPTDLVGMEATQGLKAGAAIRSTQVKPPLLVRRRETVEVISVHGSVKVRQFFVAKADGRKGERLLLESLDGSQKVHATVTGPQQAVINPAGIPTTGNTEDPSGGVKLTVLGR